MFPHLSSLRVNGAPVGLNPKCDVTHLKYEKEMRVEDIKTRLPQLLAEPGVVIAGAGHPNPITDIYRITNRYGGNVSDWVKKVSSGHVDKIELHWYENIRTGEKVDIKHITIEYTKQKVRQKKDAL